jgi:hypothetical protein
LPLAAVLAAAAPAAADTMGPDQIASDNVEYLTSFKPATGLTAEIDTFHFLTSGRFSSGFIGAVDAVNDLVLGHGRRVLWHTGVGTPWVSATGQP